MRRAFYRDEPDFDWNLERTVVELTDEGNRSGGPWAVIMYARVDTENQREYLLPRLFCGSARQIRSAAAQAEREMTDADGHLTVQHWCEELDERLARSEIGYPALATAR